MNTGYVAVVRVGMKHHGDADRLMTALVEYEPAVGMSSFEWLEVRVSVPAMNLAQACKRALTLVAVATAAPAIACEVMTESEFAGRYRFPSATERDHLQGGPLR